MSNDFFSNKVSEAFLELQKERFTIKEVPFNSDVVNDEFCIYYPTGKMFSLWRCPACGETLKESIADSLRWLNERGIMPRMVFIPFNLYGEYALRFEHRGYKEGYYISPFDWFCKEKGLECVIMTPDRIKDKVSV